MKDKSAKGSRDKIYKNPIRYFNKPGIDHDLEKIEKNNKTTTRVDYIHWANRDFIEYQDVA